MHEPTGPDDLLDTGFAFGKARVLLSAVELEVFSHLAGGPLDAAGLAERAGIHPRGARDFFDALVAMGLLERQGGIYANSPQAEAYLVRSRPSYLGGRLALWSRLYVTWGRLTAALRSGRPQDDATDSGKDLFRGLYQDPEAQRSFLAGMAGGSIILGKAIARLFPWERYRTFVDVGTAQGALPVQLALAHEHVSGVGFDLPPVGPVFEEYVASFGLSGRLRFHAGDFFTDPLPRGDVLVMGRVLHDWNLEEKRLLIAKALEALPPGGALLVYEAIIDDERRRNLFGLLSSLNMLLMTQGGFDFTGAECRGWMGEAGFRETYVTPLTTHEAMVIGIKR
ncbi:MAG: methyltransferase [Acidimicrobiales bacterium]